MNIAIVGQMASGKTTCSNHLVETLGYTRISLAEPIYWVVNNLHLGTPSDLYYNHLHPYIYPPLTSEEQVTMINAISHTKTIPNESPKPRKRLQWLGTEGGRQQVRDSIWIDVLNNRIAREPSKEYVIDDVRFGNESAAMSDIGFYVIKLDIDKETQRQRLLNLYGEFDEEILSHGSEIEIAKIKGDTHLDAAKPLELMLSELTEVIKGLN
ncbi:MAG: hypothetical protein H8D23_17575 [Candidatus Brocadiales bacterium]|nr:hypothetical protein [Candidatus Brocadiales bacterium]